MKISEVIQALEYIREHSGDIPVAVYDGGNVSDICESIEVTVLLKPSPLVDAPRCAFIRSEFRS